MNLPALSLRAAARLFAAVTFAACFAASAPAARANNISVNGLGDALSNNGVCTLREAVINANNDAATWPDCAAGSGADVININPARTITFAIANAPANGGDTDQFAARGDLDIISSITINGSPSGTTINANQLDRIFDINPDGDSDGIT